MNQQQRSRITLLASGLAWASLAGSSGAHAAERVADVIAAGQAYQVAQAESQQRIDTLSDERRSLAEDYRSVLRESDALGLYIQQLRAQIKSQQEEMTLVRQESIDIERTNIEVLPLMQKMLETLDRFVALDLPFLQNDRQERLAKLKDMMPRADVTVSEKYRRIIEAYQIEVDYGRTIEAYRALLADREVDFLRVGRVTLMYQTPDGRETGYWDRDKKAWVRDDDYADTVAEGLKIARKQVSPNLLVVPVPAASGV